MSLVGNRIASICLVGLLIFASTIASAEDQLPIFVSKTKPKPNSKYLLEYPMETKDGWIMSLLEVSGTGEINIIKTTPSVKDRNLSPIFSDFRSVSGQRFFFASYPPFYQQTENAYRELCELTSDGTSSNCYRNENLDTHDWLLAKNGDRIYLYAEPRKDELKANRGARPLDMILRRFDTDNKQIWEWNSRDWLSLGDKVTPDITNRVNRLALLQGDWLARLLSKVNARIEYHTLWVMSYLGFLDEPLCIKGLKGCLTAPVDDYVHANSLEWDDDGGIIVSSASQSTIFKIEYPSGRILWRLGGYGAKRSDFIIQNDPLGGFSSQHSARKLPNGNILIYDNGNWRHDMHSRAVEYHLDFQKHTASFVWEYQAPADYYARINCGAVQRLRNGNTLISWGGWDKTFLPMKGTLPIATEVDKNNHVVFEIRSRTFEMAYRVWEE